MTKTVKTCFFEARGPQYQASLARGLANGWSVGSAHTLSDYDYDPAYVTGGDVVELPRVEFQAQMTYFAISDRRLLVRDKFNRKWSVFGSVIDEIVPKMDKGVINSWWSIARRGNRYGLIADTSKPLHAVVPANEDVPAMLEYVTDLNDLRPYFEAIAIA